jgi:hypothetical protein
MAVNVYDQAARYVIKLDPPRFLAWLFGLLKVVLVFRGWLDTRTLPFPGEPDRTCDTVAALQDPDRPDEPIALVVESQAEPDADMLERMLEYVARFRREYRHGPERRGKYRVVGAVLNLTGPVQENVLRMALAGGTEVELRLAIIQRTLREEDAAATVAAIAAGQLARCVLPWVPLMRGAGEPGIIEEWKRCATTEPEARRRSDYAGLALVFAELSGVSLEWNRALEGWNMLESKQVLEWQMLARVDTQRRALLRLLELRFPVPLPPDLLSTIRTASDLGQLSHWFDAAATSPSLDAFRVAVQNGAG